MKGPSVTARVVAQVRATLAREPCATGDGEGAAELAASLKGHVPMTATLRAYLAGRTLFFDGVVVAATRTPPSQVVILGAGYDDRALRFRTPGVRFYEVDHPATQHDKVERLKQRQVARDDITFVPTDLEGDPALSRLGPLLSPDEPTYIICEAVAPYLTMSTILRLIDGVSQLPGRERVLAIELPTNPTTPAGRFALATIRLGARLTGEHIRTIFDSRDAAEQLLTNAGWRILASKTGADLNMRAATSDITTYLTAKI